MTQPAAAAPFNLLAAITDPAERRKALDRRRIPVALGSHWEAAKHYRPDPDLQEAIHVALACGAPLLLTGDPGTGKTQAAYYIAREFDCEDAFYPLFVRSDHGAEDLLYRFDAVAYLHAAGRDRQAPGRQRLDKARFVERGPLWRAYRHDGPAVVLIDEVDKAHRDFPNDLLNVLDKHEFHCRETGEWVRRGERPPPVVVITSNRESRLPEPFLRRCIFHHIELTPELVEDAVNAHFEQPGAFPRLDSDLRKPAIRRFWELHDTPELDKKPATAELLVWLTILSARGDVRPDDLDRPLRDLPAIAALVKTEDDLQRLPTARKR